MNLGTGRASPPALVPKIMLGASVGDAGHRWRSRAARKHGQWNMMRRGWGLAVARGRGGRVGLGARVPVAARTTTAEERVVP
jgi:hypothetical protein